MKLTLPVGSVEDLGAGVVRVTLPGLSLPIAQSDVTGLVAALAAAGTTITVTLDQADMQAANSSPPVAIAGVAGSVIFIRDARYVLHKGATNFGGGAPFLAYAPLADNPIAAFGSGPVGTQDAIDWATMSPAAVTTHLEDVIGADVVFTAGADFTGGTGSTVEVTVTYAVVEVLHLASLAFVQQPSAVAAEVTIAPPVTVRVRDQNGDPLLGVSLEVTIIVTDNAGIAFGTTSEATNPATGIATFDDLAIALDPDPGNFTLTASVASPFDLSDVTVVSASFAVSA